MLSSIVSYLKQKVNPECSFESLSYIESMHECALKEIVNKYVETNVAHLFMEGIDYSYYYEEIDNTEN